MKTKIKSISKILLFSLFLILTISCDKSEVENKSILPVIITPITIGKGNLNESDIVYSQPNFVINNDTEWQALLNNFNTKYNNYIVTTFSETNIDFNNFEVIVAFYGESSSYRVTISNVVENADNIIVTIQHSGGPIVTDDSSTPFHIVKIPRSDKPVIFQ
jgi:hypothetical protein